jgi:hypothetical protein
MTIPFQNQPRRGAGHRDYFIVPVSRPVPHFRAPDMGDKAGQRPLCPACPAGRESQLKYGVVADAPFAEPRIGIAVMVKLKRDTTRYFQRAKKAVCVPLEHSLIASLIYASPPNKSQSQPKP